MRRSIVVACATFLAAALPVPASPLEYRVVPGESEVRFVMETTWHDVTGATDRVSGSVVTASGDPFADARVRIAIDASDLDTGNQRRDRKMKEEYLETGRYPEILFESMGRPAVLSDAPGEGGAREVEFDLPGRLTIHGQERETTITLTALAEGEGWVVTGSRPVRLSDHGIEDPSSFFNSVKDEVSVEVSVTLVPVTRGD